MFKDYFLEEYGKHTYQNDFGFFTYFVNDRDRELFVPDFFVLPEFRKSFEGKKLFTKMLEIAKENHCTVMTGIVSLGVKSPSFCSKILKCYLAVGFHAVEAKNNQIVIAKKVDPDE